MLVTTTWGVLGFSMREMPADVEDNCEDTE
jgi:hypothetical protein